MNALLYNIRHLLDTVKLATINLKIKENTATYKSVTTSNHTLWTQQYFRKIVILHFFHWMSISHPATPYPISPPSHTINKTIPYGLSGSGVFMW